jgi:NAD(P)-dependent dehydrogenase (short-subunit alcohol dehydrogenase family)
MSGFSFSSTAEEVTEGVSLAGKNVVITGVSSGLGLESARVLALRGAHIIGLARTEAKAKDALASLSIEGDAVACELSEPASVRAAVETIRGLNKPIDVLMCNAGIMALPEREARYGVEMQMLTNHVGHFILVTGLLDALSDDARVVVVSSGAHHMAPAEGILLNDMAAEKTYDGWKNYGQSKLANLLFARSLQKRFEGTKRVAASLHPGVIKTNLGRHDPQQTQVFWDQMGPDGLKSIPQGAATQCYLAAHPDGREAAGRYYADSQVKETSAKGADMELAEALWTKTEELVASFA